MNVGEYGSVLNIQTGFDMSGNTSLQVQFKKPDLTTMVRTAVLGTSTFTDQVSGITFVANQYVKYTIQIGDINQAGQWFVKVLYADAVQFLPSSYAPLTIGG